MSLDADVNEPPDFSTWHLIPIASQDPQKKLFKQRLDTAMSWGAEPYSIVHLDRLADWFKAMGWDIGHALKARITETA